MAEQVFKGPSPEQFRAMLRKHGLKATPQRLAVHDAMLELGHASAEMVAGVIARDGAVRVSTASVYNILAQLSSLGIYCRRTSVGNRMYFDVDPHSHIHLYDTVSDTFREVLDDELMGLVQAHLGKRRFRGYKVDGIDIQILCHPTRKRSQKP